MGRVALQIELKTRRQANEQSNERMNLQKNMEEKNVANTMLLQQNQQPTF